ncbi:UNVERIFIED_ORG: protein-tyrosine phosphatase [Mycolicibacterium obuense]
MAAQAKGLNRHVTASSAGTRAVVGSRVHPDAAAMVRNLGGDVTGFAARQLTPPIASEADLILTMTTQHRDKVLNLAPHRLHRTFTLLEAAHLVTEHGAQTIDDLRLLRPQLTAELMDIEDPIGQNPSFFEAVCTQIAGLLPPILALRWLS